MKNAIKVLCFVLAVIFIGVGTVYFAFIWQKSDFSIYDGVNNGTAIISSYLGDSVNIKIPNRIRGKKIVGIGENAFKGSNIVSVELNNYITSIGKDAFYECEKLTDVDLKSVKSIGESAFGKCTSLKSLNIPSTVVKIDNLPFVFDTNLTDLTFEENGSYINENGIIYSADKTTLISVIPSAELKEYICPDSLLSINDYAFSNQEKLTKFVFNDKIVSINNCMFINCKALTDLEIPSNIVEIRSMVISASGIKSLTIPKTVTKIETTAFSGMDESFVIKTTSGSVAETFAKNNNIKVEIIK